MNEFKPIHFPLCRDFNRKADLNDRISFYQNLDDEDQKVKIQFGEDLNETSTDNNGDQFHHLHLNFRRAVSEWHDRPKVSCTDDDLKIDWVAHEKAAGALEEHHSPDGEGRGKVFIFLGPRAGKSVSARWLSDIHALREKVLVPAWITGAEFSAMGAYKNQAVKLVEALRGVRREHSKEYLKYEGEADDLAKKRCVSVLDGIGCEKLSATETAALFVAVEACTDLGEYDLIVTTPAPTLEAFIDQLAGGVPANGIKARLIEQGGFVEFKASRVGRCPWINEAGKLIAPYALPKMATNASQPLTNLTDGLCSFSVVEMEKRREEVKNKGGSVGMCPVAQLTLAVTHVSTGVTGTLTHDLVLESSSMFRVREFFTAIGQRKHGDTHEKFAPNWAKVVGATGLLLTKHAQGKKVRDDGTSPTFGNIAKFITEEEAAHV